MKTILRLIFVIHALFMSCYENKAQKTVSPDAEFSLTDCGGTYKGKPLPFGEAIEEWEKLFGSPTRKQYNAVFIWDNLGIVIENNTVTKGDPYSTDYEIRKHDELYIFFSNLDSPAGQKGNLKFAHGRKSLKNILSQYTEEELKNGTKERIESYFSESGDKHPSKFLYPYTPYKKSVSIDGVIVEPGNSLKELNKNREKSDVEIFSFRDNNLDAVNQWGDTKEENGEYWNKKKRDFCPSKATYTLNVAQFSDHELEFIKIEHYDKKDSRQ